MDYKDYLYNFCVLYISIGVVYVILSNMYFIINNKYFTLGNLVDLALNLVIVPIFGGFILSFYILEKLVKLFDFLSNKNNIVLFNFNKPKFKEGQVVIEKYSNTTYIIKEVITVNPSFFKYRLIDPIYLTENYHSESILETNFKILPMNSLGNILYK